MSRSFHRWTPDTRIETALRQPLYHAPTGLSYSVIGSGNALYQAEFLIGRGGRRLHQLRRRMDYVMGSGNVARTYFMEENGRLFQLPLTWYHQKGWDFSPGYELNNARFDRLMPDGCIACHGSYPKPIPFLEGKYAGLPPGIGCERCHGPGALHVAERSTGPPPDNTYDNTIVNPKHLPLDRRLDVCEQCHVHTPVTVLREGRDAFSYLPSQSLSDQAAFFKLTGSIDIVSHADRLRQSACFITTRPTRQPLECATCHNPHLPAPDLSAYNRTCRTCHAAAALEQRLASSATRGDHLAPANCVACHMPRVKERSVPHGLFTDHWIRVVRPRPAPAQARRANDRPIEPYFERDRIGPDAKVYQGMGGVVYATRANQPQALSDAAEALDRALGDGATRADAYFLLGLAYQQLNRTDEAIRALERSVRIGPDRPQQLHALARADERAGHDPARIAGLYERALQLQPALAWIRADYAHFLQAQGRREKAEEAYRAALTEQPSLAVAAFDLATLLTELDRPGEASEAFHQAVQLDPSLGEALAPLLEIRATATDVSGVRILELPVETLAVRDRGLESVRLTVIPSAAQRGVVFVNLPPGASVRILEPDGTPVRDLRAQEGTSLTWDLLTQAGAPIPSGLYHVQVQSRDVAGRAVAAQRFAFGVVRLRRL
jgi:tetratricopeptide (TPR) repeat protein